MLPPTISIPGGRSKQSRHAQPDPACQRNRRPSPQPRWGRSESSPFGAIRRSRGLVDVQLRITLLQHDRDPKVAGKKSSLFRRMLSVLRRCRKKHPKWRRSLSQSLRLDHGAPSLRFVNRESKPLETTKEQSNYQADQSSRQYFHFDPILKNLEQHYQA